MYDCDSPHANEPHGRTKLLATSDGQVDDFVESLGFATPTYNVISNPIRSVELCDNEYYKSEGSHCR